MQVSQTSNAQPQFVRAPQTAPRSADTQSTADARPADSVQFNSAKPMPKAQKPAAVASQPKGIDAIIKPLAAVGSVAGAALGGKVGGVVGKAVGDFVTDITGSKSLGKAAGTAAGAVSGGAVGAAAGAAIPGFCPHGGATLAAISGAKEAMEALS